jgi:hypothetical protein
MCRKRFPLGAVHWLFALLAAALAVPALTAGQAAAATGTCPTTATVQQVSGHGAVLDFNRAHPDGAPLQGSVLHRNPDYVRGDFYELQGVSITLRDGLNTYRISPGSTIALSCYGEHAGAKTLYPDVDMLRGSATVTVSPRAPGGLLTYEGLYGPIPGATIRHGYRFAASRSLKHAPSHMDLLNWFAGFIDEPTGTTRVHVIGSALVNVTPYVGPGPGHCREVRGAKLTSTGYRKARHGTFQPVGSSRYFG